MPKDLILEEDGEALYDPSKDSVYQLQLNDEAIQVRPLTLFTNSR